jgi:hypothetical protein
MFFTRKDGVPATDIPAYRRIMPFIMRGKNESAAYFEQEIDLERAQAFIADYNKTSKFKLTFFHLYLWALVQVVAARPRLNRFIAGSRVYQRKGIWLSFSAKKAMNDDAPVVVMKKLFEPGRSLDELLETMHGGLAEGRSDKKSHVDKELSILLRLPDFLLRMLISLQRWLDAWNLMPHGLIQSDPLYASAFIANLGSLKMDAVHHHLYEYGNIPIFACIGKRRQVLTMADDGHVTQRQVATIKYTYDERVEDGLYCATSLAKLQEILENPAPHVTREVEEDAARASGARPKAAA